MNCVQGKVEMLISAKKKFFAGLSQSQSGSFIYSTGEHTESKMKWGFVEVGVQSFIQKAESMPEAILLQVNREQQE